MKEKQSGRRVKAGFPRFKPKKSGVGRFSPTGTVHVFEKAIQLPRLGVLRLKERGYLPTRGGPILSATVSEKAGHWFVSFQFEINVPDPVRNDRPGVGMDLGLNWMPQVSDGTPFENPHALKNALSGLKHLQWFVSRRQRGSANYQKGVKQLEKVHFRVANLHRNALHQATTFLAILAPPARAGETKSVIVLENLNVSGLMPGTGHRGCGLVCVPAATAVQRPVVWL